MSDNVLKALRKHEVYLSKVPIDAQAVWVDVFGSKFVSNYISLGQVHEREIYRRAMDRNVKHPVDSRTLFLNDWLMRQFALSGYAWAQIESHKAREENQEWAR